MILAHLILFEKDHLFERCLSWSLNRKEVSTAAESITVKINSVSAGRLIFIDESLDNFAQGIANLFLDPSPDKLRSTSNDFFGLSILLSIHHEKIIDGTSCSIQGVSERVHG